VNRAPRRAELLRNARRLGGGSICDAYRAHWDGREVFAKTLDDAPPGFFRAEERGLRWLAEAGAPVPDVLAVDDDLLVLEWVDEGSPSAAAAERLGRDLAALHGTAAAAFGAEWPGYLGSLPMDNSTTYGAPGEWPVFYAEQRVLPYLQAAVEAGAVDEGSRRAVEEVCERLRTGSGDLEGPREPPRRIHGDLWSGNVHWAADGRVRLIDPAAHGGHRETDLAMLDLFGLPMLGVVLDAYDESFPLARGWRERVPLHQICPLLVHAALFGASYGHRAGAAARRVLR
jgi:fructosamine-3-kinase